MTAQTGSWIFWTSSPRKFAVPTRCTSRPGLMDTSVAVTAPIFVGHGPRHTGSPGGTTRWAAVTPTGVGAVRRV